MIFAKRLILCKRIMLLAFFYTLYATHYTLLPELWTRVIDDEGKRYKNKYKEKHVYNRIAVLGKVNIELRRQNNESKNKRKNRTRPDEDENAKDYEKGMPERESDSRGNIFVDTGEYS